MPTRHAIAVAVTPSLLSARNSSSSHVIGAKRPAHKPKLGATPKICLGVYHLPSHRTAAPTETTPNSPRLSQFLVSPLAHNVPPFDVDISRFAIPCLPPVSLASPRLRGGSSPSGPDRSITITTRPPSPSPPPSPSAPPSSSAPSSTVALTAASGPVTQLQWQPGRPPPSAQPPPPPTPT